MGGGGKRKSRMYIDENIQFLTIFACFNDHDAHRYYY